LQVRKNLYHAIYILDPSKADALQVLANIADAIKADLPIKFGLLFYSPPVIEAEEARAAQGDDVKIDVKTMEEGEQLYRLISALHGRHGRAAAFDFIDSYAQRAMSISQNVAREEARKEAFRKAAKANKATVKDEAGKLTKVKYHKSLNNTAGARGLVESTRFVEETGLLPTKQPHLVINGQLVEGPFYLSFFLSLSVYIDVSIYLTFMILDRQTDRQIDRQTERQKVLLLTPLDHFHDPEALHPFSSYEAVRHTLRIRRMRLSVCAYI